MVLTNYFLKKEIKKLIRKAAERPHQFRSMDAIKTILLLCDSKDWNIIRGCIEKLKSLNKTVNTAIYAVNKKDVPTWYSNYLLLRADRDVDLWGFPDAILQKQFYHLPADLLIDFTSINSTYMYYMCLKHPCTFKVGIKHSEDKVYDFSIIPPHDKNDIVYLFDQLVNYLITINSK
jgi:hypothetical protein